MTRIFLLLCFIGFASQSLAARAPGSGAVAVPGSEVGAWPPSSPQTNKCGGGECFPTGGGPGPRNGEVFLTAPQAILVDCQKACATCGGEGNCECNPIEGYRCTGTPGNY